MSRSGLFPSPAPGHVQQTAGARLAQGGWSGQRPHEDTKCAPYCGQCPKPGAAHDPEVRGLTWGSSHRAGWRGSLAAMALTDRDRAILEFERSWWTEPGPKELAIRERFDLSTTRYYELLNALLEMPEALDHDPLVVRRLRRLRDRRRRARLEARPTGEWIR